MHWLRSRRPRRAGGARVAGAPLVAVVAAGLVLAGCGGSPEPDPLPKSSTSEAPSASPSAPPVMPAAAKEKTKAGAIAFARGFLNTLNYSGATGNTQPLRSLYMPLCTRCEAVADAIDRTYSDGGSIDGGAWRP